MNLAVRSARGGRGERAAHPDQAGQSTVELALALPFVAMLVMLVLQAALVARDQVLVVHAARSAVREASVGAPRADVDGAAQRVLPGADVDMEPGRDVGDDVTVRIEYRSRTDVPLVGSLLPDVVLRAQAVMRLERAEGSE